ncbi:DUF1329 domain-containing protein [Pseudomonas sp. H9]|uniref:DUF1329 domain-containing protein n=1 Tax=Pseudomonas sp. H9 TaxID=483968 RepID=UPI001057D571|nr:DUF1329 domain-containing protein [Pseudomonas sp. H9]TDF83805.1 DUF1329 domain-containing protein [Pseudomonas sp. H9]
MTTTIRKLPFAFALLAACSLAHAADNNLSKLDGPLTPVGAERAGNADGSIPAWNGGLKPGAAPIEANGNYVNPFADEKPLLVINKGNASQYKDLLTPGQQAMITRYPEYRINVYPTHRTARIPQEQLDQTRKNVGKVKLADGGNGLENYSYGVPFPMPTEALEVLWNHLTRYRGGAIRRDLASATVQENGDFTVVDYDSLTAFRQNVKDAPKDANLLFYTYTRTLSPARFSGEVTLAHEPINQVIEARNAWQYIPGQRRVRRAPTVAYDSSARYTFGQVVSDSLDGYNGAPDRYNWKLIGKEERVVPYNAYKLMDKNKTYKDLLKTNFANTDMVRYEKHRVWVLEANLKPGQRHVYAKRRFYFDEDSWQLVAAELYDSRGELWRVQENHMVQFHDVEVPYYAGEITYDLMSGRYAANTLTNEVNHKWTWGEVLSKADFTPALLKRLGK